MSLKFAVVGSLLGALGTRARAERPSPESRTSRALRRAPSDHFRLSDQPGGAEETRAGQAPTEARAARLASFSVSSEGPLWVISGHGVTLASFPFFPS